MGHPGAFARPAFTLHRVGFTMTADVTAGPVRSYRTVSPLLPAASRTDLTAVWFLWHFPWGLPRSTLSITLPLRCPDFASRRGANTTTSDDLADFAITRPGRMAAERWRVIALTAVSRVMEPAR